MCPNGTKNDIRQTQFIEKFYIAVNDKFFLAQNLQIAVDF
jgi:hypothetical protein